MQKPILLYQTSDSNISVEVTYIEESFWLSQKAIAELFGVEKPAISKHLSNLFESNEIEGSRKVKRNVEFYNLDVWV